MNRVKQLVRVGRAGLELFGFFALVFLLVVSAFAQGTPFGNGRGSFRGPVYVPSVFSLIFGDNTSTDVYLAKNGSNVVGISGNLGASGSTANTTTTPASPVAWGTVAMSSNTATVTFPKAFTNVPVCVGTDFTTANLVKIAPTATTAVISDTVGASDVIQYICVGNPN
jgi:hypothetical protein